ncbi:MAG: AAA family ATPase [Cyanobacteria bacterium SBLK]|nr:AAA family ATPase [Cyanobacteria bacterium SBLK]
MKVRSLQLKYFKKFSDRSFEFTDKETGLAQNLVVLIGANGSGKTTILQAIAATLGQAIGQLKNLQDLDWPGFNYELMSSNWGRFEPEVNLEIQFSLQELKAIQEFYEKVAAYKNYLQPPAHNHLVNLKWHDGRVQANTAAELFQFKGRQYAKQLMRSEGNRVFEKVGGILWYIEQRTSTSLTPEKNSTDSNLEESQESESIEIDEDELRGILASWQQFASFIKTNNKPFPVANQKFLGEAKKFAELNRLYNLVFPGRRFETLFPRENINDITKKPWFYLFNKNENKHYEISEMSAGERAILPILIDFVNWNIHNSVILIDELELHLHPPLQQTLLGVLPSLGKNNQFIITTHSDYVAELVPEENIYFLEDEL